uniref:Putative secreted mucin n=1 Tax=Desmodus rotundus TaxID=9430 RepID=K9IW61_DESRO
MAGSSFPSLKRLSLSMWARGSLGLGSLGVPSTRAQRPTVLPQPTMLCRTHVCSCSVAPWRTMLSRSRTPSPTVTPSPMETLGPSTAVGATLAVGWM